MQVLLLGIAVTERREQSSYLGHEETHERLFG